MAIFGCKRLNLKEIILIPNLQAIKIFFIPGMRHFCYF